MELQSVSWQFFLLTGLDCFVSLQQRRWPKMVCGISSLLWILHQCTQFISICKLLFKSIYLCPSVSCFQDPHSHLCCVCLCQLLSTADASPRQSIFKVWNSHLLTGLKLPSWTLYVFCSIGESGTFIHSSQVHVLGKRTNAAGFFRLLGLSFHTRASAFFRSCVWLHSESSEVMRPSHQTLIAHTGQPNSPH